MAGFCPEPPGADCRFCAFQPSDDPERGFGYACRPPTAAACDRAPGDLPTPARTTHDAKDGDGAGRRDRILA